MIKINLSLLNTKNFKSKDYTKSLTKSVKEKIMALQASPKVNLDKLKELSEFLKIKIKSENTKFTNKTNVL